VTTLPSPATKMKSYAGDDAAEVTWPRRYRGDLAAARCGYRVMLATMLPSHVGDGAAKMTWSQHGVDAESCWRQRC
jgi:hypothetical protein